MLSMGHCLPVSSREGTSQELQLHQLRNGALLHSVLYLEYLGSVHKMSYRALGLNHSTQQCAAAILLALRSDWHEAFIYKCIYLWWSDPQNPSSSRRVRDTPEQKAPVPQSWWANYSNIKAAPKLVTYHASQPKESARDFQSHRRVCSNSSLIGHKTPINFNRKSSI